MTLPTAVLLVAAGFVSGVVNTLAGGGSFVALSVLLFMGLPAPLANGTNRVAVLAQSAAALGQYRSLALDPGQGHRLELPTVVAGALCGAGLAVVVPPEALERVLALCMLVVAGWAMGRPDGFAEPGPPSAWRWPALFAVSVYGGFAQAGVGLLLLPVLVRTAGLDAVRANARKVVLVAVVSVPALLTFLAAGLVDWATGLVLALGSTLGGVVGARLTSRLGPRLVWRVLFVTVAVTAVRAVFF